MSEKQCPYCNGSGGTSCPPQVSHYNPMTHMTEWRNCPFCGGSGRKTCRMCNGKGKVENT